MAACPITAHAGQPGLVGSARIDRAHRRAKGLRDNAHHHISRALVAKYHTLGIETLNVAGIRSGLQSKALSDAGMSGLLDHIRYKAQWYGTHIVEADQWYPSSKTCCVCGVVNHNLEREPKWGCPSCGVIHDRNENAARNLRKLALLGRRGCDAPGRGSAGRRVSPVKLPRMKGEPSR